MLRGRLARETCANSYTELVKLNSNQQSPDRVSLTGEIHKRLGISTMTSIKAFLHDESGAPAIEYCVIAGTIGMSLIGISNDLKTQLQASYGHVGMALDQINTTVGLNPNIAPSGSSAVATGGDLAYLLEFLL
jgi:Flp pilus assembly pilin Flp